MGVFGGCQIVLDLTTAVRFKVKSQLRKDVTSNGGIVSFIVTKKSTHVVCNDGEKADISYKCKQAAKYGLPIVSMEWIHQCVDSGTLLDTDQYLVVGKTRADSLKEGKISATIFQKKEKKKSVKPYVNVKKFKAWIRNDKNGPAFTWKYKIAKYAVFMSKQTGKKPQTFTVFEIHVDTDFSSDNYNYDYKYRVSFHSGDVQNIVPGQCGIFEYRYCSNVDEVLAVYSYLYKQEELHGMILTYNVFSKHIGSLKFRQMARVTVLDIETAVIEDEVCDLVELIWSEALGELEHILSVPVTNIKIDQIVKAEAVLKQIKSAIDSDDTTKISKLMTEFYNTLPHVDRSIVLEPSEARAWISRKNDTCQLVKDMIFVSEATNWSMRSSTQSKYKALGCVIHCINNSTNNEGVKQYFMSSLTDQSSMEIQNIYSVSRSVEYVNFTHDVLNKKLLFHASKVDNIVGILSRGLLMPKVVVDDLGGTRSDPGMLGSGIYFASSASTSIQYSTPSKTKGSRFMLICEVALGKTKDMYENDLTLTAPPEGYHSVHGVKSTNDKKSAFTVKSL